MTIEAMKQALEALSDFDYDKRMSAITALRQAIVEAEKREWVGLTDEEIISHTCECIDDGTFNRDCAIDFALSIQCTLQERNK